MFMVMMMMTTMELTCCTPDDVSSPRFLSAGLSYPASIRFLSSSASPCPPATRRAMQFTIELFAHEVLCVAVGKTGADYVDLKGSCA